MTEHAEQHPHHFTIVSQAHQIGPDPKTGALVGLWTITFRTPSGVQSFVQIPDADYSAKHVAALVAPKAAEIEQVSQLGKQAD